MDNSTKLSRRFYLRLIFRSRRIHLARTLYSTAVAPIVLGILALIPLLLFIPQIDDWRKDQFLTHPWFTFLISLCSAIILVIVACWFLFKRLPPQEYAT